jgi:putative solute:sodium symporter small subunit
MRSGRPKRASTQAANLTGRRCCLIDNNKMSQDSRRRFWSQTLRLTFALLGLWLLINFAVPWFARSLNQVRGFGFSAGYWLAAEGALLMYLAIIVIYVWRMDVLERRYLSEMHSDDRESKAVPDMDHG